MISACRMSNIAGNVRLSRHGEYPNGFLIPFTFHVVSRIPAEFIVPCNGGRSIFRTIECAVSPSVGGIHSRVKLRLFDFAWTMQLSLNLMSHHNRESYKSSCSWTPQSFAHLQPCCAPPRLILGHQMGSRCSYFRRCCTLTFDKIVVLRQR
jgi:hypothetical protein